MKAQGPALRICLIIRVLRVPVDSILRPRAERDEQRSRADRDANRPSRAGFFSAGDHCPVVVLVQRFAERLAVGAAAGQPADRAKWTQRSACSTVTAGARNRGNAALRRLLQRPLETLLHENIRTWFWRCRSPSFRACLAALQNGQAGAGNRNCSVAMAPWSRSEMLIQRLDDGRYLLMARDVTELEATHAALEEGTRRPSPAHPGHSGHDLV